ncbi:hypothetical protein JCM6882_008732 [Rhodosporidiobolus microsporus]
MLRASLPLAALAAASVVAATASELVLREAPAVVESYTSSVGSTWTNGGCFSDLLYGSRALPNLLAYGQKQTIDACIETCEAKGYKLCGVEYRGECWGANSLADWSTLLGSAACEFTCADNTSQLCGGTGGVERASFQLYAIGNTTVGPTTTTTTTTAAPTVTPTGPVAVESYTNDNSTLWTRSGCYSDMMYGERALPNLLAFGQKNTVDACLDTCQKKGYELCGVEYHGECWGANAQASWSTKQDDSACELECWDNTKQPCGGTGGASRATFQLYKRGKADTTVPSPAPTGPVAVETYTSGSVNWARSGCYSDMMYGERALPNLLAYGQKNSVDACLDECTEKGWELCGVEYHGECWGANSKANWSTKQEDSACELECWDNTKQLCGGTGGYSRATFQLYGRVQASTITETTTTATTTTTTTSSATTTSTEPTTTSSEEPTSTTQAVEPTPTAGSFLYADCVSAPNAANIVVNDFNTIFDASNALISSLWTVESCNTACSIQTDPKNMNVCGLETTVGGKVCIAIDADLTSIVAGSDEALCAEENAMFVSFKVAPAPEVSTTTTTTTTTTQSTTTTSSAPVETSAPPESDWVYTGCALPAAVIESGYQGKQLQYDKNWMIGDWSVESCQAACEGFEGMLACALNNANACYALFARDDISFTPSLAEITLQPENECGMTCASAGQPGGCGGSNTFSVYVPRAKEGGATTVTVTEAPTSTTTTSAATTTTTTTTTTTSAAEAAPTEIGNWKYKRCISTANLRSYNIGSTRLIANDSQGNQELDTKWTVESCNAMCETVTFLQISGCGVTNAAECWAFLNGPESSFDSLPVQDEASCSLPCKGNEKEKCGGDGFLSLWVPKA